MIRRLRQWWADLPSGVVEREPLTDEREAQEVLDTKVQQLRHLGYEQLRALNNNDRFFGGRVQVGTGPVQREERQGQSGRSYLLETQVMWDDYEGTRLDVWVTLYEERLMSRQLVERFLIAPDDSE